MNGTGERDINQRVHDALVRNYMDQLPMLLLGNLMVAALVLAMFNDAGHAWWLGLHITCSVALLFVAMSFKRAPNRLARRTWICLLSVPTLGLGLLWGAATHMYMDVSEARDFIILATVVLGLLSASFHSLSLLPPLFYCLSMPVLLMYGWILLGEDGLVFLAFVTFGLLFVWLWLSRHVYHTIFELFCLRFQNEVLIDSLHIEKEQVERSSLAKTRFLASASHDLRQPLQAQRLFAEAIRSRAKDTALQVLGDKIIQSQQAMQSMLDALLDTSRLDAGIVEPKLLSLSLHRLFSSMAYDFSPLAAEKGLHLHIHWPPKDAWILSDPGLLESIMRNLLSNAIRYTDKGTVMLGARKRGENWLLEVRDSGVGIPIEQQELIFDEFHQLGNPERDRSKGLGLGLSIVRRLCDLLGHALKLSSKVGQGSVLSILIPVAAPAGLVNDSLDANLDREQLQRLDILVIDDDPIVRDGLHGALSSIGLHIRSAADRDSAMILVESHTPDVMIVDYRLRDHDTGTAVIAHIRKTSGVDIPALLLTGDTDPDRLLDLQDAHCPVLHKPVSMQQLLNTIHGLIPEEEH